MKNHRLKVMAMFAVLSSGLLASSIHAQEVDTVIKAGTEKVGQAQASQERVNTIADQTYNILQDFINRLKA